MLNIAYLQDQMSLKGYRKVDLARELNVTRGTVTHIIKESKKPSLALVIEIIKVLELDANVFLNLKEEVK